MQKITIIIVDDHRLVRETWSYILNSDPRFKVIGECECGEDAVAVIPELEPDVVIMDINLPGISGIDATETDCSNGLSFQNIGCVASLRSKLCPQNVTERCNGLCNKKFSEGGNV